MKKKLLIVLLIMTLVFPLVLVEESQAAEETFIVTPEIGVKLRAEKKEEGAAVAKLKQGSRVDMLEKSGKWLKVSYEGKEGYVKAEHVKSLDLDLVAAYKHYAAVLEKEIQPPYYTLLHDFTQDGLEELYFIYLSENREVRHTMLSGEEVLFDEAVVDEGLIVYWDDDNYYIVQLIGEIGKAGDRYTPEDLGIESKHEFVSLDIGGEIIGLIQSGNLSLNKAIVSNNHQYIYDFETNGEIFEDEEDIEIHKYEIDDEEVTKEEWKEIVSGYRNAPHYVWFSGHSSNEYNEEESNYEETIDQLYALYKKYGEEAASTKGLVDADQIAEIEWYTNFKNLQAHGGISIGNTSLNYLDEGEIDYISLLTMALSHPSHEAHDPSHYPRVQIDDWIYKNFGLRMVDEQVKEQIERYENAFLAEHESDYGIFYTEVHDDYYAQRTTADGIAWLWLELDYEPTIVDHYQLEDDFIALAYMELGPQKELNLMGTAPDYIIVKKVEAANGDSYYPYITTLQSLDQLDYEALSAYAENLDVVKEHKEVKAAEEAASEEIGGASTKERIKRGSIGQEKTGSTSSYVLMIIGGLLLIVSVVLLMKGRKSGGTIKTSTIVTTSLLAITFIGLAIFIGNNPSSTQNRQGENNLATDPLENDNLAAESTGTSVKDVASSLLGSEKSKENQEKTTYVEALQYAEDLLNDASDSVESQWSAYRVWDGELNNIYSLLKDKLSEEDMEALRVEQRAWLKERDNEANPEDISSLQEVETLNGIVRERTLYLIDMYFDEEG